jgi:protoporphyrinogen oxidase
MKIAVVGGGLTGLSAAYYLSKKGHQVSLFEKDNQLGGLAMGVSIDGVFVDKYYHHIFAGDRCIIDLIKEVGLGEHLVFKKPPTAVFYQRRIYPFTSALDLLRFTPLNFIDRLRFGLVGLYLKAIPDGKRYSATKAPDWLKKFYGSRSYQIVWEPLLRSKFGKSASDISMAWFWSRIHDRSFSLGYLRGGFQLLADRMRKEIEKSGGTVKLGVSYFDHGRGSDRIPFDKVIVTTPLPVFLDLFKDLPPDYVWGLKAIKFRRALSMVLVLKKPFMDCYWLNINGENFPFVAVVEQTNFIPPTDYGGQHILYLGSYLDPHDPKLKMTNEDLFDLYLPYLQKINPDFDPSFIIHYSLFTDSYAQPVVTTDYATKIPPLVTPIKNVYLATMAQVYPQDRGMNQAVRLGKDVCNFVLNS